jgi:hypothetical protein
MINRILRINTLILIIGVIALVSLVVIACEGWKKERNLKNEAYKSLEIQQAAVKYYQNKKGQTVAQVSTNNVSLETFKHIYASQISDLRSEIGNLKNLQAIINTGLRANGRFSTIVRDSTIYDTVPVRTFAYGDGFLELRCMLTDSAACQYSYSDSVSVLVRLVKPANWRWYNPVSWFYQKESITTVTFKNPSAKPTHVQSFFIKK